MDKPRHPQVTRPWKTQQTQTNGAHRAPQKPSDSTAKNSPRRSTSEHLATFRLWEVT